MLRQLLASLLLLCLLVVQHAHAVQSGKAPAEFTTGAQNTPQLNRRLQKAQTLEQLTHIGKQVDTLKCSVLAFWQAHGLDGSNGVHATLSREGQPMQPTVKTLVGQSRHLWAFTNFAAHHQGSLPDVTHMARSQAQFLMRSFIDSRDNCFFSEVSQDGSHATNTAKDFVDQAPAVFALAAYARRLKDPVAARAAMSAFTAWDAAVHDSVNGGYFDGYVPAGGSVNDLVQSQAADTAASTRRKALNTQLHALLMIVDLVKLDPANKLLQERLAELVADVLTRRMVVTPAQNPDAPYLTNSYAADWSDPSREEVAYFGILAEYVWYTMVAIDLAVRVGAINSTAAQDTTATVVAVGANTLRAGYDSQYGGILHAAVMELTPLVPATSASTSLSTLLQADLAGYKTEKYWWVQLEGALAMMSMFKATGDQIYLDMLDQTLDFLSMYLWDEQYGELYMVTDRSGQLWSEVACGAAGSVDQTLVKACGNKSSWHTGRALVQLYRWLLEEGVQGMTDCSR